MDEQQGKRDVVGMIRKLVELAMPNLRHYYRITRKARIVAVYACNGEYFADVQPLRNDESPDPKEPVVPRVALPVLWGGPDRGVVCPPVSGVLCDLAYYDGDPNYPYISNIRWGGGMNAPHAELNEFVIQLENGVEIRIDKEKRIVTLTPQNVATEAGKGWTVKAGEQAVVEAPTVLIKGMQSVTLEAPVICQCGNVTTSGEEGTSGMVTETATRVQYGDLTVNGNLTINGNTITNGNSYARSRTGRD